MLWSHGQYKADEEEFRKRLFELAGLKKPLELKKSDLKNATDQVYKAMKEPPVSMMEALERTISSRQTALEFHNEEEDSSHAFWISVLVEVRDRLTALRLELKNQKPSPSKTISPPKNLNTREPVLHSRLEGSVAILTRLDQAAGRCDVDKGSTHGPARHTQEITAPSITFNGPARPYEECAEDTAVINLLCAMRRIRDWVKALWGRAMRGSIDLVTLDQLSGTARDFAHKILAELDLVTQWRTEGRYIGYAKKIGLLDNITETVEEFDADCICVKFLSGDKLKVYVYSLLPKSERNSISIYPKVLRNITNRDVPGQLDRWIFCAAISGWDSDTKFTKMLCLQEWGLLAALNRKLNELLELKEIPDDPSNYLRKEAIIDAGLWKDFIQKIHACPDPWTLCHLLCQASCSQKILDWALFVPHMPLLVYGEKYRMLVTGSQEEAMRDFRECLPPQELRTANEIMDSYRYFLKSDDRRKMERMMANAPWGWRFSRDNQLSTILARFSKSKSYISVLDKLYAELKTDNGRCLNLSALPPPQAGPITIESRLQAYKLTGPLYTENYSVKFISKTEYNQLSTRIQHWADYINSPAQPEKGVIIYVPGTNPAKRSEIFYQTPWNFTFRGDLSLDDESRSSINKAIAEQAKAIRPEELLGSSL
ncbi:hypothetical protein V502_00602 [Pseudogymnoascus sp. VKM F-4520 (FW-2644)]|nr:hypothetical protein V502_00602 [Pseudogymnoascus sp. VKM F-4520 (FW-2644)]